MNRLPNTNINGFAFESDTKIRVWEKGRQIPGEDPRLYRLDACGAIIAWDQYGIYEKFGAGWEIDHIKPVSMGGNDSLENLQPLQWQNNRSKGNNYPYWDCSVSAKKGD